MIFLVADGGSTLSDDLLVALSAVALGSLLAWVIGARVAYLWDDRKRRREADLAALATFYRLYGEFFSTWKLWAAHTRFKDTVVSPDDVQWSLLQRAEQAEGGFEALLVKLASERGLRARDVELLGCFREGYQTLRETIRKDKVLGWRATRPMHGSATHEKPNPCWNPSTSDEGYEQYRAFKALVQYVAILLEKPSRRQTPLTKGLARVKGLLGNPSTPATLAIRRILRMTDRPKYAGTQWWKIAKNELRLGEPSASDRRRAPGSGTG